MHWHSFSLSLSSLSVCLSLSLSLVRTHSHLRVTYTIASLIAYSLTHLLSLTWTLISCFHTHTRTQYISLTFSHTLSHFLSHTLSFISSLCLTHTRTHKHTKSSSLTYRHTRSLFLISKEVYLPILGISFFWWLLNKIFCEIVGLQSGWGDQQCRDFFRQNFLPGSDLGCQKYHNNNIGKNFIEHIYDPFISCGKKRRGPGVSICDGIVENGITGTC